MVKGEIFDPFEGMVKWWGYLHENGNILAKRYSDKRDLDDARESPFVQRVFGPFMAKDRKDAINFIVKLSNK